MSWEIIWNCEKSYDTVKIIWNMLRWFQKCAGHPHGLPEWRHAWRCKTMLQGPGAGRATRPTQLWDQSKWQQMNILWCIYTGVRERDARRQSHDLHLKVHLNTYINKTAIWKQRGVRRFWASTLKKMEITNKQLVLFRRYN